ncbi:UNVERIFIED_CONTAM: hypothetical protein FKN15_066284 [Acipenser sinensis]
MEFIMWALIKEEADKVTALTQEGEDEHTLSSEACAVNRPLFFHTADSPCSRLRATASEDNATLRQLTGKPAGTPPDYRGRWCTVSRGHPGRPNPPSPRAALVQLSATPWKLLSSVGKVDVTLDPDTAHRWLILSAEGKRVRWGETRPDLCDNPEKFDYWDCVLGRESISSGRCYWQVQVGGNTFWRLGVSRESAERKGRFSMTPQLGYWTLKWRRSRDAFTAATSPQTPLPRILKPQKLGVYLDYEEGQLSFYNVETRSHIYTFTDMEFNHNEKLYPLFWTRDENTDLVLESPDPDPVSAAD